MTAVLVSLAGGALANDLADPDRLSVQTSLALYLAVSVNQRDTGLVIPFTQTGGQLRTQAANLRALGVAPAAMAGADGEQEIFLEQVTGLRYQLDMAGQRLLVELDAGARVPLALSARTVDAAQPASAGRGGLFNYDSVVQLGARPGAMVSGEIRLFSDSGVFSTTGMARVASGQQRGVRYDSFWQTADPQTLRTTQVGDMISSGLSWSRPVRMGGFQWRKNFALRPDVLTYPTATLSGSALVPSTLSLLVNGVPQYSANVPDGPFVLGQVAGINGAGEAQVVTRDALGRATVTTLPLYVDVRMLAPGLADYSVEIGALRRQFGIRSFDYAGSASLSASGRYGLNDALTVEAHAEGGRGLANAGAGVLARLGRFGVASANLSASSGAGGGRQAGIGYQYLGRRFSIDLQRQATRGNYRDLATGEGSPVPAISQRLAATLSLAHQQSISISHLVLQAGSMQRDALTTLSYSASPARGIFASISGFTRARQRDAGGVSASLSFAFGQRTSAGAGIGRQDGRTQRVASISRAPDFGGGMGFNVQAGQVGDERFGQAQLRYLGQYGQLGVSAYHNSAGTTGLLEASGTVLTMGGAVAATRQAGAAFAFVSTGMSNIPVLHENRIIGTTGKDGFLLVPNLTPNLRNQLAIDVAGVPVDVRVRQHSAQVVPRSLAGVLVSLPVERYRAASLTLVRADGTLVAPGTVVRLRAGGGETVVGHDGLAFIEDLAARTVLVVGEGTAQCSAQIDFPEGAALPYLGRVPCAPAGNGR